MQEWISEHRTAARTIFTMLAIVCIGLVGYAIYLGIDRKDKVQVELAVVPSNAKVTIDGKDTNPSFAYLHPGKKYKFKAQKEGFKSLEIESYVGKDNKIVTLPLTPESEEAKKWAENNQDRYSILEAMASKAANEEGEKITEQNPLVSVLPYKNLIYSIGYRGDPSDPSGRSIIIVIDARPNSRTAALVKLGELGGDITKLKIEFANYENPFHE